MKRLSIRWDIQASRLSPRSFEASRDSHSTKSETKHCHMQEDKSWTNWQGQDQGYYLKLDWESRQPSQYRLHITNL